MVGCCSSSWCRPVCIWNSAPWSLSVVYIDRTNANSSATPPRFGNQSAISTPSSPCFLNPTWSGKILGYGRVPPTTSRECLTKSGDLSGSGNGVSANVLPAYFVSAGFGSKLSSWLTPPERKTQMTDFAFGVRCGLPSGGAHFASDANPSRWSIAPRASPVKPSPTSARNVRRFIEHPGAATKKHKTHKRKPTDRDPNSVQLISSLHFVPFVLFLRLISSLT